jgi:hypothetical protein
MKYTSSHTLVWMMNYFNGSDAKCNDIVIIPDDDSIIITGPASAGVFSGRSGQSLSVTGETAFYVAGYTKDGVLTWLQSGGKYNGSSYIAVTSDSLVICGQTADDGWIKNCNCKYWCYPQLLTVYCIVNRLNNSY